MAKDPVCGMEVDERTATNKSQYQGQTYYFCSPGCKQSFDKEPARYMSQSKGQSGSSQHSAQH